LRHVVNLGQGAALATGIQYALGQGAQVLVTFDADGQHDPADIRKLVEPVIAGEADVALGSRFLAGALGVPRRRRMLLKIAILFTGLTDHIWLSDAHNGLRALSASAARQIRITQNRMAHASEIVSEIARLKLRYVEVPVQVRYTDYSQHKGQRATDALNIMIELLEERLRF
jgi:glycosyltransferase involved in cell wall biosynthesis